MEIQKTQRLAEIEIELLQQDNNKGYDKRKKCYKDAEDRIKELKKEAEAIINLQAEAYLKNLGYAFEKGKYKRETSIMYICSSVYVNREVSFNYYLSDYNGHSIVDMEKSDEEVKEAIEKSIAKQLESHAKANKRYENFRELKSKLSEISYSNDYRNDGEGTEINIDLDNKNSWDEKSTIKLSCDADKTSVRVNIATEIADKEKIVSMIDAIKQVIATYTDQKFVKRD